MKPKKHTAKYTVSEALKLLEKKYGPGTIMRLGKGQAVEKVPTIQTGIYSIDKILGGGFPKGRIVELYGNEGSGKTTLAFHTIAEAQRRGEKTAFIDVEHSANLEYASRHLGVNINEMYFSQPDSAEQALDIVRTLANTGEFSVIVLDSVAALTPAVEFDGDPGKSQMGSLARFLSSALKQIIDVLSKSETTLVLINQLRSKIGVAYGNPEYTTGGYALKYYASQRIMIRRGTKIDDKDGNVVGYMTSIRAEKNKISRPYQKTSVEFVNGKGFDKVSDLFLTGLLMGIISKDKITYSFNKKKLGAGEATARETLAKSQELQNELLAKLDEIVVPEAPVAENLDEGIPQVEE